MPTITIVSGQYRFVQDNLDKTLWYAYEGMTLTYIGRIWVGCDGSLDWDLPDDASQLLADSPDADRIKDAISDYSVL